MIASDVVIDIKGLPEDAVVLIVVKLWLIPGFRFAAPDMESPEKLIIIDQ